MATTIYECPSMQLRHCSYKEINPAAKLRQIEPTQITLIALHIRGYIMGDVSAASKPHSFCEQTKAHDDPLLTKIQRTLAKRFADPHHFLEHGALLDGRVSLQCNQNLRFSLTTHPETTFSLSELEDAFMRTLLNSPCE